MNLIIKNNDFIYEIIMDDFINGYIKWIQQIYLLRM